MLQEDGRGRRVMCGVRSSSALLLLLAVWFASAIGRHTGPSWDSE